MKTTGKGILLHHFWGEYSAEIILRFDTEHECSRACDKLKMLDTCNDEPFMTPGGGKQSSNGWVISKHKETGLAVFACIHAGPPKIDAVIKTLIELGADKDKISSLKTSCDRGEPFEISIEIEDENQLQLI